jgi:hypothetical protein
VSGKGKVTAVVPAVEIVAGATDLSVANFVDCFFASCPCFRVIGPRIAGFWVCSFGSVCGVAKKNSRASLDQTAEGGCPHMNISQTTPHYSIGRIDFGFAVG